MTWSFICNDLLAMPHMKAVAVISIDNNKPNCSYTCMYNLVLSYVFRFKWMILKILWIFLLNKYLTSTCYLLGMIPRNFTCSITVNENAGCCCPCSLEQKLCISINQWAVPVSSWFSSGNQCLTKYHSRVYPLNTS